MKKTFGSAFLLFFLFFAFGCAATTPLMDAAKKGDINAVKDLLAKGVDINETGYFNTTALREAVDNGQLEAARLLLDKGANVNAQDHAGETALLSAALKANTEIVMLLIDKGAIVDFKNDTAGPPLAYASREGIAKLLLEKGADVNATNNYGGTPLSAAAMAARVDVVQLLLEKGANLETALAKCEGTLEKWSNSDNKYLREMSNEPKQCVTLLQKTKNERDEAKRQEQEIVKAKILEAQKTKEMKEIVKEVLSESSVTTDAAGIKKSSFMSDVDRPTYKIPESSNKFAIVVGIEKYSEVPEAVYAEHDAAVMKDHLVAMGFPQRNIILLTGHRATRSGISKTWKPGCPITSIRTPQYSSTTRGMAHRILRLGRPIWSPLTATRIILGRQDILFPGSIRN